MASASLSFRCFSSRGFPAPSTSPASSAKRTSRAILCRTARLPPMPPINPKDPFIAKLAAAAAASTEDVWLQPSSSDRDLPPYLDLFDSPKLMATPAQVERSMSYNEHRPRRPPPDLPSILLNGRIVYIGMPLVPAVTELVIAQLMYLQWMDSKEPIYLYINSTGTTRDDGETVALEYEGFAIYDALMQVTCQIETVAISVAMGQACLLLAAGKKGRRFMMPHAKAMLRDPVVPSSGLMQASDVLIRAKEATINKNTLVKLIARHTGNSIEKVSKVMERPFYMNAEKAKEFGVIDKILWRGQEKIISEVTSPEEWDKKAGIKVVDGI